MFTMLISLSTYIGEAIEALCAWTRLVAGSQCPVVAGTRSSGLTHHHYSAQEAGGRGSLNKVDLSPSTIISFKFAMQFFQRYHYIDYSWRPSSRGSLEESKTPPTYMRSLDMLSQVRVFRSDRISSF